MKVFYGCVDSKFQTGVTNLWYSGIQEGRGWQVGQEAWETLGLSYFKTRVLVLTCGSF